MIATDDDAPLTSRSPGAQMHERPGNFGECTGANETPMQDLSDPAAAGKAAPPSSGGHTNTLIRLQRRLRTVSPRELPIVPRAVLLALAGRGDETAHAWPAIDTIAYEAGASLNTTRRALDELAALGWIVVVRPATARVSAKYLIRFDPEPPADGGVQQRYPRGARAGGHGGEPQGVRRGSPGVPEVNPRGAAEARRGAGAAPEDHREDPREDPIEDHRTQIAHAREGALEDPRVQTVIPFGPSEPPAPPEPKKSRAARAKASLPVPPEKPRPAAERYLEAFVLGLADAGITITPPRASEGAQLGRVAAAHAREGGAPITGDALLAWIRREAVAFGKAITRPEMHRGGRTAFGFGTWLDNGRPVQERRDGPEDDGEHEDPPWPIAPYKPPPPTSPFKPPKATPEQVEALKRKFVVGAANG